MKDLGFSWSSGHDWVLVVQRMNDPLYLSSESESLPIKASSGRCRYDVSQLDGDRLCVCLIWEGDELHKYLIHELAVLICICLFTSSFGYAFIPEKMARNAKEDEILREMKLTRDVPSDCSAR